MESRKNTPAAAPDHGALSCYDPKTDPRNLVDQYKGLTNDKIIALLDQNRTPLEIAIENLAHDFNIGTIIRNANAFNIAKVHIIGKRKYNRRGAMVTDKYLHIDFFENVDTFVADSANRHKVLVAIENNRPGAKALQSAQISPDSILIFGSESNGISDALLSRCAQKYYIEQLGSTRSINVGCASAIALYEALRRLDYFNPHRNH